MDPHSDRDPLDVPAALEALAESAVDEAMKPFLPTLTEPARLALRTLMICDLLTTPAGLRQLRALSPDPLVDRSADLPRGEPLVDDAKASGTK